MSTPYRFSIGDAVAHAAPQDVDVPDGLGYAADARDIGARVCFISSAGAWGEARATYSDLDRVMHGMGSIHLDAESYPGSRVTGIGIGLNPGWASVCITAGSDIVGVRVWPAVVLEVRAAPTLAGPFDVIAFTSAGHADDNNGSSVAAFGERRVLMLSSSMSVHIDRIQLYTREAARGASAAFALFDETRMPVPYALSSGGRTTRRGGVYAGGATLVTARLARESLAQRSTKVPLHATLVSDVYATEALVHDALMRATDGAFPLMARLMRTCVAQETYVRTSTLSRLVEYVPNATAVVNVEYDEAGIIRIEGHVNRPLNLVRGVTYVFTDHLAFFAEDGGGDPVVGDRISVGVDTRFVSYGSAWTLVVGGVVVIREERAERVPSVLPPAEFVPGVPLDHIVAEIEAVVREMPAFEIAPGTNAGHVVHHIALLDADHVTELSCDRAVFLPGAEVVFAVYGTHEGTAIIHIDYDTNDPIPVILDESRRSLASFVAPLTPGVHVAWSATSSIVSFRVCAASVVHAPMHPPYYTSAQSAGDPFASVPRHVVIEHPRIDLVPLSGAVRIRSNATFLDMSHAPDVAMSSQHSLHAGLLCKLGVLDVRPGSVAEAHFVDESGTVMPWESASGFCDNGVPWSVCSDVSAGLMVVHGAPHDLCDFTMWWKPASAADVTVVHGHDVAICTRAGRLVVEFVGGAVRTLTDAVSALVGAWHMIAVTSGRMYIDGVVVPADVSVHREHAPRIGGGIVLGCPPDIDLRALSDGQVVVFDEDARARATECTMRVAAAPVTGAEAVLTFGGVVVATFVWDGWAFRCVGSLPPAADGIVGASEAVLHFGSAGHVRSLMMYTDTLTSAHIARASSDFDAVIGFARVPVVIRGPVVEQEVAVSDVFDIVASYVDGGDETRPAWMSAATPTSAYVTPASLLMLGILGGAGSVDPLLDLVVMFNVQIEDFSTSASAADAFEIRGSDGSASSVPASACRLASTRIILTGLGLVNEVTYTLSLSAGRFFNVHGRVPCVASSVVFTTR